MSLDTLLLVLAGALCHAVWNIAAKRVAGGVAFVWLFGLVSTALALPVAWLAWPETPAAPAAPDGMLWLVAAASGLLHVVYSLVLQRGYRAADFSVVYPVARGMGPLLTVVAAVLWLGEAPGLFGALGIALVLAGVFAVAGGVGRRAAGAPVSRRAAGVAWGAGIGLCIGAYTLLDGWAVRTLALPPVPFYAVGLLCRTVLLAPWAWAGRHALVPQWRAHRAAIVLVGCLSPLAYGLVLVAMQQAPLSYVAPVREVSMLVGTWLGAWLLRETIRPGQAWGTALMLGGVVVLALA